MAIPHMTLWVRWARNVIQIEKLQGFRRVLFNIQCFYDKLTFILFFDLIYCESIIIQFFLWFKVQENSFQVWRRFVTSWLYLKYLNKQSNLFTCTTQEMKWFLLNITFLVERIKGLSTKSCAIVNILFILYPFIWILFTL
jgi:hypothetical protein